MTATLTERRVERDSGTTPPMLHRQDPKNRLYSLCGKKLVELVDEIAEADCVVCEALWRKR